MRLSLFSRLILGYLVVFGLVMVVSLYAIRELQRFDEITRSILDGDNRILDYEKKLADSFLSQVRYERKFVITKDQALFQEFLKFKSDFERYLSEALEIADPNVAELLSLMQQDYQRYLQLFDKEMVPLKANREYAQGWYAREKNQVTDKILGFLAKIEAERQQGTYNKVRELADAGGRAREGAVTITFASLAFILILSLLIARSINKPISVLKNKTREIAKGRFEPDLRLSSPPEIGELAAAFNLMCRKLGELDKMKSDFFASMSHELRTPLTSIKEGTGLLLEGVGGATTEKQRRLLTILAEESNRLIGLVNSLMDLSKMEAGMMNYSFERVSLAPLIKKALSEITPLIEAKGIQLETEVAERLPTVKVDSERILQALRNLIGNAVKFTPRAGRVKVAARSVAGKIEFSVRDTGPGIAAENLKAIFDKFHQGDSNGTFSVNGTGLGLAIAKHIIVSHGGEIWAENHPDRGSTFIFVLPC
jgi:two-component system, NtrC family, sensor histidine kinase GlrK